MDTQNFFTETKNSYYFVENVEKHFPLLSLMEKSRFFNDLSKLLHVTIEELYDVVNISQIPHKKMFEYVKLKHIKTNGDFPILIEKNTHYKYAKNQYGIFFKDYYHTYLKEHNYIGLLTSKIAGFILTRQFYDFFTNDIMYKSERRYPKDINITRYTEIGDIKFEYNHLTCEDIVNLLTHEGAVDEMIKVPKFNIYSNSDVFYIELPPFYVHGRNYENSLSIPFEALYKGDWSIVENLKVSCHIKPNANEKLGKDPNNFFYGLQKDAPYFYFDDVNKIKELFIKYVQK